MIERGLRYIQYHIFAPRSDAHVSVELTFFFLFLFFFSLGGGVIIFNWISR